ncbi:MAG: hypothetical protein V7631_943, partial [Massilia sp.]
NSNDKRPSWWHDGLLSLLTNTTYLVLRPLKLDDVNGTPA